MHASDDVTVERAVLTLALGKPVYWRMAINLARSFRVWHGGSDIRFFLATDSTERLPSDLEGAVTLIHLAAGEYGYGFSPKLHLDRITRAERTLFIDADCLCVGNLDPVFARFEGHDVSVIGREDSEGELFGDIASRCRAVGVTAVPRFCGGLYYLRRGPVCDRVFAAARRFEQQYSELGLVQLRGVANEEPLIGLGMAVERQRPVPEDGTVKAEPMFFSGPTEIDVFAGYARLTNDPGKPRPYAEWGIPAEARPVIVHFNCAFADHAPYTAEVARLEKVMRLKWPVPAATVFAFLTRTLPEGAVETTKTLLRPAYRVLWGTRRVKPSARI